MVKDENYRKINEYYNKFTEDKRLYRRHGLVEFNTSMHFIKEYLKPEDKIIDIGCGTGRYSLALASLGYDVTAIEYSGANFNTLKSNLDKYIISNSSKGNLEIYQKDARNLNKISSDTYDVAILFGPLYHLQSFEDRIKAVNEAKRVIKPNGKIFIAYIMNDYGVLYHGFIEGYYNEIKTDLDENYKIKSDEKNLYAYSTIADIDKLNKECEVISIKRFSQEGPSDYIRNVLNKMDEKTFEAYMKWHLKNCEKPELIGAGTHIVDIVVKQNNEKLFCLD